MSRLRPLVLTAIAVMVVTICIQPAQAASDRGTLEGVVKNASGQPLTGAFVKLKNAERRLTFLYISQAQGRYSATDLPAGKYTVQGVGAGFESAWSAPVEVMAGKTAKLDLSVATKLGEMLPPAWPGRVPETEVAMAVLPEGTGKQIVASRCTTCHEATRIVRSRRDREHWQSTIKTMRGNIKADGLKDLTEEEATVALDYLAANFPPLTTPNPNSRLPRTLLQGKALKYRVVQYAIENRESEPHDIAVDAKGNGWVVERAEVNKLGRLDPKTLEFTEVIPPTGQKQTRLGNLQIDPKGIMWFPDGGNGRWVSYDTNTGKFETYDFPNTGRGGAGGNSMAVHPNGTIWATGGPGGVRMLNPATKEWKVFDSPTYLKTKKSPGAYGIAVDGSGNVWWAENNIDHMGKVNLATGAVEEFKIPLNELAYPRRMNTDAEGNVWVGVWAAGKLMKIDHKTNEMTLYTPPTKTAGNYSVSVDKTHNLVWVSLQQVDKIARFNPVTQEWTEFPLPEAESDMRRIEVDQHNPNRVWWTGNLASRMGFVEVLN